MASKSPGSLARLESAPSSSTDEIATLTSSGSASCPKSSCATSARPSLNATASVPRPGALKAAIGHVLLGIDEALRGRRRGKAHGEAELPVGRPSARLAAAGDRAIVPLAQRGPQHLARIVVERGAQIEHQMRGLVLREGIAMHADARSRRHLGAYAIILQGHGIIAGGRALAGMVEAGAVAGCRIAGAAGPERHDIAADRHHRKVGEVRMTGARKMRVAEALDRAVLIMIAGGMIVAIADGAGRVGIGRKLHHPERGDRAGEGMPCPAGADHRVDRVIGRRGRLRLRRGGRADQRGERQAGDEGLQQVRHRSYPPQVRTGWADGLREPRPLCKSLDRAAICAKLGKPQRAALANRG